MIAKFTLASLISLPNVAGITQPSKAAPSDIQVSKVIEVSFDAPKDFPDMAQNYQVTVAIPAAKAAEEAARVAEEARVARINAIAGRVKPYGTYSNNYAAGNCTLYVASRIAVPDSLGNANNWADALGSAGWTVSSTPYVGAIAQTTAGWAGHVAIVEAINGDTVTVSEMNFEGYGLVDDRVANISDFQYIY